MAAQTTVLTEFATNGDSRTYTTSGHTQVKPKLVIQKRKVPSGTSGVAETNISVIHATVNSTAEVLPQKVSFTVTVRVPVLTADTAVSDALIKFRDIIAGDEFGACVNTQGFLKP